MSNMSGQFLIQRKLLLELLKTLTGSPARGGCHACFGVRRIIGRDPDTLKAWAVPCPYCGIPR